MSSFCNGLTWEVHSHLPQATLEQACIITRTRTTITWPCWTASSVHYRHRTNRLLMNSGWARFWDFETSQITGSASGVWLWRQFHYHYLARGRQVRQEKKEEEEKEEEEWEKEEEEGEKEEEGGKCKQDMKSHFIHSAIPLHHSHLWRHHIFWDKNLDIIFRCSLPIPCSSHVPFCQLIKEDKEKCCYTSRQQKGQHPHPLLCYSLHNDEEEHWEWHFFSVSPPALATQHSTNNMA